MPFRSEKQRRFMHKEHPEIAERWENEAKRKKSSPVKKKPTKKAPAKKKPKRPRKKGY